MSETETETETETMRATVTRHSFTRGVATTIAVLALPLLLGCGTDRIEHTLLGSDAGDAASSDALGDGMPIDAQLDGTDPDARTDLATSAWAVESSKALRDLRGVFALGASTWAVGDGGTLLRRSAAGVWSDDTAGVGEDLRAVWALAANDVWAAGATLLHFDGSAWSGVATPAQGPFAGLWGAPGAKLWVIANAGAILARQDDGSFTLAHLASQPLYAISGPAASDRWAVGAGGLVVHGAGGSWTDLDSNQTGTTQTLYAAWGRAFGDLWIAGAQGTILRVDAAGAFHAETSSTSATLHGVWGEGAAGSRVWAVGSGGTILRREGGVWQSEISGTSVDLLALHGREDGASGSTRLFAVGRSGTILRGTFP